MKSLVKKKKKIVTAMQVVKSLQERIRHSGNKRINFDMVNRIIYTS